MYLFIYIFLGLVVVNTFGSYPSYFTRQLVTPIGFKWDDNTCLLTQTTAPPSPLVRTKWFKWKEWTGSGVKIN